jgi:hypothetical protein
MHVFGVLVRQLAEGGLIPEKNAGSASFRLSFGGEGSSLDYYPESGHFEAWLAPH